jgi:hypothetical protein
MNNSALDQIRAKIDMKRAEMDAIFDDVTALERAMAILQTNGKSQLKLPLATKPPMGTARRGTVSAKPRIFDVAVSVLREAGKPLSGDEIFAGCISRGIHSSKLSVLGSVYRGIKNREGFIKLERPGLFALTKDGETG